MSGPFDFLHIKGRTVGSSNELSFDVLDAAKEDLDSKKKKNTRTSTGPKPSQGSYHGVAGTSTLSAAPEVERRKRARKAHTARIWAIAIIAIVAFVGSASFLGYQLFQGKMDFNGRYQALVNRLSDVDKVLVKVDQLMQDPLDSINTEKGSLEIEQKESADDSQTTESVMTTEELVNMLPGLKRELNAVMAEAQDMNKQVRQDKEKTALREVERAASYRRDMITKTETALELLHTIEKRVQKTALAWDKVLAADDKARDAAEKANTAQTEESTRSSQKLTESARDLFREARGDLEQLEREKPPVDFAPEKAYIEKREESLEAALKTADALLMNNREGATKANSAYNTADKEAVALASKLPASETDKVKDLYREDLQEIEDEYAENRAAASTADSAIRAYLGT